MSLKLADPKEWRGRSQLIGKADNGNVVYVAGPRVGRWAWDSSRNSLLATLELDVYGGPLKAYDALREKRIELQQSGKLTAAGVADEMAKFVAMARPTIDRAKENLAKVSQEVATRRAKIRPVAASNDDPVHTMQKLQALNDLSRMSRREIMNILAGDNPSPIHIEAALEADPRVVPSVGPALRKHLETTAVRAKFGPEIEELDEIDRAIETASRALEAAESGIGREIKGECVELTRAAPSLAAG
ncbi:hypothetical protein [Bradyrhizobium sp. Ec3.3]|uniref:hypothetical protein n=1 Tax=Bradyrhizobium sp. Ec3.3 TaxID=189753 RepID=UPI00041B1B6B|nr:hypothetical protein [Bradyrhizobium sp. Ec3.3]